MEAANFDVDSGLGSLLPPGAVITSLVPPHTISELQLEDVIVPNVQPVLDLQLPDAAPELPPVIQNQMVNAGAPGEVEINDSQAQEVQPVMAHDKRCYRDHLRNYQYPYTPLPNEDAPVDDDEYMTDDEDSSIATSKRRRIEEPVEESPEQLPVEESYTQEILESTQPKQFVSTFSPPASTSTNGEPLDMSTPAFEPLFMQAKAGALQANPDQ